MKKEKFTDVFAEIYRKHALELDGLRKIALIKVILVIFITVGVDIFFVSNFVSNEFSILLMFLLLCCSVYFDNFLIKKILKEYADTFKTAVLQRLIYSKNENYVYIPEKGVDAEEYLISGFERIWDFFYSEDKIEGKINSVVDFKMSQVKTEDILEDNGIKTKVVDFQGLYGMLILPNTVGGTLEIIPNSNANKFSNDRVNFETEKFEEYYDVITEDKIWAAQIINSETIKNLIEIKEILKSPVTIKIENNRIFFKAEYGGVFEPSPLIRPVNFTTLYRYYRIIDIPRYIYESLAYNISRVDNDKELKKVIREENKKTSD